MRCKPPGPSIRLSVCLLLAASTGCADDIALGSECPPFGGECLERRPRDNNDPGPFDSGNAGPDDDDAGPSVIDLDSQVPFPDAGLAPSAALFPKIQNPSLDITGGSIVGGLLSYLTVQSSPWLSCSPPGFGPGAYPAADLRGNLPVGAPGPGDMLTPTDGNGLINLSPDGWTLTQNLTEPLTAGQRYAFMIDVASTHGSTDLSLEVQGGSGTCFSPELLALTKPATPGMWTSVCITFTPTKDYRAILFAGSSAAASSGSRLFLDNIRADPACN